METTPKTDKFSRYYAKNKEAILARRKARRDALKAKGEKLPRKSRAKDIDESKLDRYNELMAEMETLKKDVAVIRKRKSIKETLKSKADKTKTPDRDLPDVGSELPGADLPDTA
jgi:hypothetical protein